jgi:hypothetical protein
VISIPLRLTPITALTPAAAPIVMSDPTLAMRLYGPIGSGVLILHQTVDAARRRSSKPATLLLNSDPKP